MYFFDKWQTFQKHMSSVIEIPKTAAVRGKTAPVKLAHIVLRTKRYEDMVRWYQTVLEAEVMVGAPMATFLTYDEEHHRIAIVNRPDLTEREENAVGMDHCAFTYATLDDLFFTYERLRDAGITPYWCVNHGPTLSMYYRDPDGNQIELQIDVFDTNEGVNEWLAQSDFASNPIGVKFDPDDLIERHRGGEAHATLLARPRIDPSDVFDQLPPR